MFGGFQGPPPPFSGSPISGMGPFVETAGSTQKAAGRTVPALDPSREKRFAWLS